ncbi:hypothetical protein O3M35_003400 [Rhynocoris fuscipes]|uniref:Uncharacterized protein n=1 Tax=Rhynocoris fuscipes TaxID=488301 RepID=A0AAW1CJW9_9HEMI
MYDQRIDIEEYHENKIKLMIMGIIGDILRDTYIPKVTYGPKQKNFVKKWMPSAVLWSVSAFLALLYITEWQPVLGNFPYYSRRRPYVEPTTHLSRKYYIENQ